MLFLKVFSRETDLWVTLGDFTIRKIWKGNPYLTENRLSKTEMWRAVDNHNIDTCHTCAKGFLDSNFDWAVINKNQIFIKLPQISHINKNRNISSIIGLSLIDQLLLPCKFYGSGMCRIYFFIFASCEPLISLRQSWITLVIVVHVPTKY